jgi:hypothetical protein
MGLFSKFFSKTPSASDGTGMADGATGLGTYTGSGEPAYRFNTVGFRQPGPAYHAPLLQFQTYPETSLSGNGGVLVNRFFHSQEPQWLNQPLQPVNGGTSGIITGQTAFQPLIDTSNTSNTSVG